MGPRFYAGIDPSKWETVFERFVQGDGSSTRTHGGSGLGLSLVRAFVEAMGGEIAILPKAGSGTRIGFNVVLKQSDPAIPPPIGSRPQVPSSLNFRNQIVPLELRKTRILLSIPAGITLSIVSDWLSRKGLQASRAASWADTVLSVEEWARGKSERENVDSLNDNNRGSRNSSWGTEVLLVVIDVSFMPGMNKNPPDMAEVKGYLSRLDYFHKRGAEVACLLSPSTPIGIRNELRESMTVYIANKPLYASKLWRLLLCMVKIGEAEDISTETDWKNPLQELHQDMLVAEGTGVQLAVGFAAGASKLDLLKVDIPERQGGKGGEEGELAKTPNKSYPHFYATEGVEAPTAQNRRWSDSDRHSGDLILFSGELNGSNSVSTVWADNQLANTCRLERMGSSKLQDSGRFSGLGGQALLASGIEIGTEIASMTSRSLPESLVEPYSTPTRRGSNPPRRTSSIPSSTGGDKMQLEAWLQEASVNQFFSEPGLKPRPDLFPQPELLKRKDIVAPTIGISNSGNSHYVDVYPSIESPRPHYSHSASAPLNRLQRTNSGSMIPLAPLLSSALLQDLPSFSNMSQTVFSGPPSPSPPRPASSSNLFSVTPHSRLARTSSGSSDTVTDTPSLLNPGPLSPSHTQTSSHSHSSLNSIQKLQRTRSGGADVVVEVPTFPIFGPPSPSSHSKTTFQNLSSGNVNPWLARAKSAGTEVVVEVPLLSIPPVPTPLSPSSRSQNSHHLPLSGNSRLGRTRSGGMDIVSEASPPPLLAAPPSPSFRTQNSHPLPVNGNSRLARTRSGGMDTVAESPPLPPQSSVVPQHLKIEAEPLLPSSKDRVSSDVEQTTLPLHGMHILVAEDTPILRRLAVTLLEKLGAHVVAVNDGQAAVEAVLATHKGGNLDSPPFDAVVMDCQMPRLDGYSATEAIRAAEKPLGLHLPIVALTAHAMASDEQRCLLCGMDAYLSKPANKVSLVQTLKKLVK